LNKAKEEAKAEAKAKEGQKGEKEVPFRGFRGRRA
jgi:hypothetical protein